MALPPVPLRVAVLESLSGGAHTKLVKSVLEQAFIGRDWAVWLNDLARALNLATPAGTFANNAAAIAGGLPLGQTYQTATGELRVVV
jgi:hypothetical protein